MTPDQYCRERTRRAASSFYLPMRFLDPERRAAMFALYAFCREVDDLVDGAVDPGLARAGLEQWRQELARLFAGEPHHPVGRELLRARRVFHLPADPFLDLLDGMTMDLEHRRYATLAELDGYCERVAVTVGRLAVRVFLGPGPQPPELLAAGDHYAHHLGLAFQLTNILRDVASDASLGRVYIPREYLLAAGLDDEGVLQGRERGPLRQALLPLARAAHDHFHAASLAVRPRSLLWPAQAMAAVYQATLHRLEKGGFDVFGAPVALSWGCKLRLTLAAWWREREPWRLGAETP